MFMKREQSFLNTLATKNNNPNVMSSDGEAGGGEPAEEAGEVNK